LIQTTTLGQNFTLSLLPFLISFFLGLVDPLIQFFWECRIRNYAEEDDREFPKKVTDNYIDFARKSTASIRMFTALILTSAGGAVALIFNRGLASWVFLLLVLVSVFLMIWVDLGDPQDLAVGGLGPYYDSAIFTMILNAIFIATIYLEEVGYL